MNMNYTMDYPCQIVQYIILIVSVFHRYFSSFKVTKFHLITSITYLISWNMLLSI